jgi:hypothetical protein
MFYLLLILPHLLALVGLAAFAYYSSACEPSQDSPGGWDHRGGEPPPPEPDRGPSLGGPPLDDATLPRRRMRVGERLSELYPGAPRRAHDPNQPAQPRVRPND